MIINGGACVNLPSPYSTEQSLCTKYTSGDYSWATGVNAIQFLATDTAFAPGTYTVTAGSNTQNFTVNEGDTATVPVTLPVVGTVPATFSTTIQFLDPRANPDAAAGTISSSCAGDRSWTIPPTTTTAQALTAFVNPNCVYTLNVAGRSVQLSQTASNTIALNRLDVDDVLINREDGTSYTTKGTYQLYFGGVGVAGPYNTATGIDILPGTYDLAIKFTDFDGPQTQNQTFTVP
jgi:hypothetical protein